MTLTVLNDTHIGAIRSAGTTPTSQIALRKHILQKFGSLLPDTSDLLINGDLFDTFNAPITDVLHSYEHLSDWLHINQKATLYNSAGNHDLSKSSNVMSSFQFIGKLLTRQFPNRYVHIEQPTEIPCGYVIPHLSNQSLFDGALEQMPQTSNLFLHCNLGNKFAEESDQSLNLSLQALDKLPCDRVVLGHEHQSRTVGKVIVVGNQIPTSVSDWLGGNDKYYAEVGKDVTLHRCAKREEEFAAMDWDKLEPSDCKFIQITGTAATEQSFDVITAVNQYRRQSEAFVISNAVKIKADDNSEFTYNLESVKSFSIVKALKEHLTTEEFTKLEEFMYD